MRRNMQLILMILRYVQDKANGKDRLLAPDFDDYEPELVN